MKKLISLFIITLFPLLCFGGYEDYTTFSETDSAGDITLTSATRYDVATMRRDANSSIYKSYGANHFGSFDHDVTGYFDTKDLGYETGGIWMLNNTGHMTDSDMDTANEGITAAFYYDGSNEMVVFKNYVNDSTDTNNTINLDTLYYFTIVRTTNPSNSLTCKIYDDSGRTNLVDTLTVTYEATTYQYLGGAFSRDSASVPDREITYYVENLDINEAAPSAFIPWVNML